VKIFVTGHNVFIGSHLVNALRSAGHDVAHTDDRLDLTNLEMLEKTFLATMWFFIVPVLLMPMMMAVNNLLLSIGQLIIRV
jgi:UDP-glucose 4-epimerase